MVCVAVLMKTGFEESETLTIVDILRRAEVTCHTFSFDEKLVTGMHGINIVADQIASMDIKNYDMLVLPGGRPGGDNLLKDDFVIDLVTYFNSEHKYIAAMCSGTLVLEKANVIEGKRITGYTGYETKLTSGIFVDKVVVVDDNIITSQGPATAYPFAYKIAETLGKDVSILKESMLYNFVKGK